MTSIRKLPHPAFGLLLLLLLCAWRAPARGADEPRVITRFSLREPAAAAVFLAGEFNGWNTTATALRPDGAGGWSVEVALPPGRHPYKFIVDGRWQEDPAATDVAEDGLGGRNSVRVVNAPAETPGSARAVNAPPRVPGSSPGAVSPLTFAGQTVLPGQPVVVSVPLGTDANLLRPIREAYGRVSTAAKLFLALPPGFAPERRAYPVLIVSATTDGEASSVGAAGGYVPDANDKGFVVIAVDGEFAKPTDPQRDSEAFRWALVQAGLQALTRQWPAAKAWPVATGGVSGGGGYASHQALMLAAEPRPRPLLGIFLAVSGWNPVNFPAELRRAPFAPLHQVPVFLSAGEKDRLATAAITEGARAEMQREGFRKLRYERFPGGHELWGEHLRRALDWFVANARQSSPPLLPPADKP